MAEAGPVLPKYRLHESALWSYLTSRLEGFELPARLEQFRGGQSNPSYLLTTRGQRYVLRKKPPGELLATAHQVEREYRAQRALAGSRVPVAPVRLLCEDPGVIGTPFYVMDYVDGRIFTDLQLPTLPLDERRAYHDAMTSVLATLHMTDYASLGLSGFGRTGGYVVRQINRWAKQYEASRTADIASMNRLLEWLPAHVEASEETALVHGDFRLGNMLFHPFEPRIVAALDWELATLGHPLADLAFRCLPYYLPAGTAHFDGLTGCDLAALGIPTLDETLEAYCRATGRKDIPGWTFFIAFAFFRLAAICQGVYSRALRGNAADPSSEEFGQIARVLSDTGWQVVERS